MLQTSSQVEQDWKPARLCERGSVSALCHCHSTQVPAASLVLGSTTSLPRHSCIPAAHPGSHSCTAIRGKLLLGFLFILRCWNQRKSKLNPRESQDFIVTEWKWQSVFFLVFGPSQTQGYKNSLQIQTEEQTAKPIHSKSSSFDIFKVALPDFMSWDEL